VPGVKWALLLVVATAVLAACGEGRQDGDRRSGRDADARSPYLAAKRPEVIVTREDGGVPRECGPARITAYVLDFLATIGAGDAKALPRFLRRGFTYSVVGPKGIYVDAFRDDSVKAVLAYVRARDERGERMRLVDLAVVDAEPGRASVGFSLLRYARDLKSRLRYSGKATVRCADGVIFNWQIVPDRRPLQRCPAPPTDPQRPFVVACTVL
jgi:hypothetical protein